MFIRILNPVLMILFGLGVGVIVARQREVEWKLYGAGALIFIGSQVLHIPFNAWVLNPLVGKISSSLTGSGALLVTSIALGVSAGVFEETFRYVGYRFWVKEARRWKDGLMFGAGHGGIEAILVGLYTLVTVIYIFSLSGKDLKTIIPADQLFLAQQQIDAFWALPWYAVLLGALERAIAICFHLAASVLVLQVFRRKNIVWLFAAIGLHTVLDALAVYVSQIWGPYATEGVLAVFALFCVGIIFMLKTSDDSEEASEPVVFAPEIEQTPLPYLGTTERLEESKYE
ncbi:MAG TPA: YhfC family glutamic-type intramembrane protease [Anaerolineales bacterium]|nr:YhfC family glutamic-type intramembrane protease [Anaerolineales bacterium]